MKRKIQLWRALSNRNYRLFFSGQSLSLIGTWMTRVATSWLIYRLSHSATMLGLAGFAEQIPTFFLVPLAGVMVDRWNRHRVLLYTQILAMIQSALLAYFTLAGTVSVPLILGLAAFQGMINAFDMPARQAFVLDMLEDRSHLSNAIALNSSMVNLARLVGPSIAGFLIALTGEGGCFALDALSYIAVIISLLMMNVRERPQQSSGHKRIWHDLLEGFAYVKGSLPIRSLLLMMSLMCLMGMPYTVLLPVVVIKQLHGGANMLGVLMGATGVGALTGALYLASRESIKGLGRIIFIACGTFGVALIAFSQARTLWLAIPLLVLTGLAMMIQMASTNTVLQTLAEEQKRGRVMSFYAMAFTGMLPLGSLLGGSLADRIGAPATFMIGGACCICGALVFLRVLPKIRASVLPKIATAETLVAAEPNP